ncbi:MAG: sugar phosphate nucleotidyltransferase [Bacteroidota bacterium]
MKAIIPVAGAGTKLRPLTYTQPKPLIPVAGKPIIAFLIDDLVKAGVDEFVFVIGYLGEKIKNFVEERYPKLEKTFVYQHSREGLGHAIWTAKKNIKDAKELIIVLGDTIFDVNLKKFLANRQSCLAIKKVTDPRNFGVVEFDQEGLVKKVVEKPRIPKSNMAMVGIYKINEVKALLKILDSNIKNNVKTLGEFQLTDAIMGMIEKGIHFTTHEVNNWFDCGQKGVLLETNASLLEKNGFAKKRLPKFDNTIIIQPVAIGKGCKIKNSIIGPHVTIGNNTMIEEAIVKDSIIGNYASIKEVVLQKSVVGNDAAITGLRQSLNIGDNTEIDFS